MNPADIYTLGTVSAERFRIAQAEACAITAGRWGGTVTYSLNVFLPLTNMCRNVCGYCGFVRNPSTPEARYMEPEEVMAEAMLGAEAGCKEALFSLGERPESCHKEARSNLRRLGYSSTCEYLRDMCEMVLDRTGLIPHVNAGPLEEDEMAMLAPYCGSMGLMLESTSPRLFRQGQAHYRCPGKEPIVRLRTLEVAGGLGIACTTGLLVGIGESWSERIDSLHAIKKLHRKFGHIQEVIIQGLRAKTGTASAGWTEPSADDVLRTVTAARLILDADVSVQVPPNLSDDASSLLNAGINDWGGISPVTRDLINPERPWPTVADLRQITESAGFRFQERLAVYPGHWHRARRNWDRRLSLALSTFVSTGSLASAYTG